MAAGEDGHQVKSLPWHSIHRLPNPNPPQCVTNPNLESKQIMNSVHKGIRSLCVYLGYTMDFVYLRYDLESVI